MPKKDDEMSVSSETKGPMKSFQALMGEGEKFSRDKLYVKAIQCYTEALDLIPQDDDKASQKDINDRLNGLVARSACYLKIGKNDLALQDAEESLKSNKEFTKGLYQKAEALYAMGEFELALMFYHRGKKLRPDLREFQLGINKAQEAIDNSVGDPNRVKLEASGDLSVFYKNDEDEAKKKKKQPMGYVRASQKKETAAQRKQHAPITNPKTTKQLLGDLYEDRVFLDKIISNGTVTKANTKSGDAIYQLASEGIDYLDSRTDFWRQQEPIYARARATKKPEGDGEIYRHIHRELEAIDNLQNNDQFVDARRRALHLVDFCERIDERKFSEKQSVLADVYSRLGNAYLELGDYNKALEYHNRDLRIAETKQYTERRSRALDNLGRVYARSGQFPQAIQVWERKVPLATSPLEKAWLFHEIGQCQFGLGDYEKAKRYGERSYSEAVAADDAVWQLNAKVLIAHSQTKLRQYRDAEQTFNEALTLARDQNDVAAERAIERAIKEVRDQIDKGAADSPPDRPETNYDIKVKSSDNATYADENLQSTMHLAIFGDNGSSGPIDLRSSDGDAKKFDIRSLALKRKAFDAGKLTKLAITYDNIDSWPLEFIEVTDVKRKNKVKFLLPQPLESIADTVDLYPEGCIVPPSLVSTAREEPKKKAPSRLEDKASKAEKAKPKSAEPAYDPNRKIDYTVTVQTGNVANAGTDAKVFLTLIGEHNKISKRALDKPEGGKDPFEKNSRDVFKFNDTDVGRVKKVTVEHDDSGMASAWFLESVEVKANNETTMFPVGRWLDKKEGDKRISLDLEPNKRPASKIGGAASDPSKSTAYVVTVQTGNVASCGTDAKVFITLNGDKYKVNKYPLQKPEGGKDPFEKGNKDVFKFDNVDIGQLKTIVIEHDDGGMASGWFVDWVEVKVKNDTTMFPVGRWLDKDEDDGKISLELEPNKKPASKATPAVDPNKSTPYVVTVQTGNVSSAGTDAKVFITLNGDKSKITKHSLLKPESGKDPFEKGNKDVFKFDDADIGQLKTITIEHDNGGMASGWFLDSVEVKVKNDTTMFPVGRWLDKDEDDGKISLELEPNKKPASKATTEPPKPAVDPNKGTPYVVTVQTGNVASGGTDAKVSITLNGDKNKITKRVLQKPEGGKDPFEKGNKDVFKFDDTDIGQLRTITIEHDDGGMASGWFLDWVEVKVKSDTTMFPVGRWLDKYEDDGKISLDLEPNKKPASKATAEPPKPAVDPNKNTPYVVTVQTGSVTGAGTDAKVSITLNGDKNKITKHQLQKPEGDKDPFEKGGKDVFKFDDTDVGKLQTINIEHDGTSFGAGWFLDSIEVKVRNDTYTFPVGRWLDAKEDDGRISLELEPNKKPPSKATAEPPKPAVDTSKGTPYVITVQTGNVQSGGTDSKVFITLNGDKNKITKYQLQKSETNKDPFEKGSKDVFKFSDIDVGKLKTIIIEHDDDGMASGWFVDSVEVKVNNDTTLFPVGRWLDKQEDDGQIRLELEPNKKPPSRAKSETPKPPSDPNKQTPYVVTVQTGSVNGAGTDANVYLTLTGEKDKISRHQLVKPESGKNAFEKSSKDVFKFNDIDIGKLKTIVIEHDGSGIGAGWFLDSVEVKVKDDTTTFPVGRWLDAGEDDKRISLELEPNKKPTAKTASDNSGAFDSTGYDITVRTGNVGGAGTDANVYLSLHGDKSKLERYHLKETVDKTRNMFEKGSADRFRINTAELGTIKTIRIEHDGSGIGAGWYVDSIEVVDVAREQTYKFPVDRWLDAGEGDKRISLDLEPDKKPGQLK